MLQTPPNGLAQGAATHLALHLAARQAERESQPVLDALGLRYGEFLLLTWLWAADGADEERLPEAFQTGGAPSLVEALVLAGYAERGGEPPEATRVWLTDAGWAAQAEANVRIGRGTGGHASGTSAHYLLGVLDQLRP